MFENLFKEEPSIIDYGNGIFRFRFRGDKFAIELGNFIKSNQNLKIISVVYEPTSEYHGSYFIITEPRN